MSCLAIFLDRLSARCIKLSLIKFYYFVLFSLKDISFFNKPDYSCLSDIQIIQKILDWQKDLFEVIVNRYSDKIFRYFYYQFNFEKDIAEELVQEVFLKVWQNLNKFDLTKKFETWLFSIAHNLAIDRIKTWKIWTETKLQLNNEALEFDNHDEYKYKLQLLKILLGRLDYKYREVLILYYFDWKSYDEIAEILDTTKNTVWSWIKRAKDKLKEIIERDSVLKEAIEI